MLSVLLYLAVPNVGVRVVPECLDMEIVTTEAMELVKWVLIFHI
tara:strand:- start:572 stop:703 length:132 start_codon:yes stop_codon:yes gene_type:complete